MKTSQNGCSPSVRISVRLPLAVELRVQHAVASITTMEPGTIADTVLRQALLAYLPAPAEDPPAVMHGALACRWRTFNLRREVHERLVEVAPDEDALERHVAAAFRRAWGLR
jgi:hypothetical protein